jgi:hypothetical protein
MTESDAPQLARVRAIARAMDSAISIPGTGVRFGLDPVLGLVPGLGDVVSSIASIYIVMIGIRLGAPRSAVLRMMGNIAIDTLVGSVPILGDLFDVGWKSNNRNVALIEQHVAQPEKVRAASRMLVAGLLLALIALTIVFAFGAIWLIRVLARAAS